MLNNKALFLILQVFFVFRKFIFILLCCGSFVVGATIIDCSSPRYACVSMVGGIPTYTNPYHATQDVDFEDFLKNGHNAEEVNFLNVDIDGWDLATHGPGFIVTVSKNTYLFDLYGAHLTESIGTPNFPNSGDYEEYVINDPVEDDFDNAYIVFEDYGNVVQTQINFINQGETIIAEGVSYSFEPIYGNYFYSDVLSIGGSGGTAALTIINGQHFSFRKIRAENANITITDMVGDVLLQGYDRAVYLYGNVNIVLSNATVNTDDFKSQVNFYIENDGNTFDLTSFAWGWSSMYTQYVEGEGPSMYFTCTSVCTNNVLNLNTGELHLNTLSLIGVSDLHIDLMSSSVLNVEHFILENSSLTYDAYNSTYYFSLSDAYDSDHIGSLYVDGNSSFVVNSTGSNVKFYHTNLMIEGYMNLTFLTSTSVSFDGEVEISTNSNAYMNFQDTSIGSFGQLELLKGTVYINFADTSKAIFFIVNIAGGSVSINAQDASDLTIDNLNVDTTEDSYINFQGSAVGQFFSINLLQGNVYFSLYENSQVEFATDIIGTSSGVMNLYLANNSSVTFKSIDITSKVKITQELYTGVEITLLRFEDVNTFLNDNLEYHVSLNLGGGVSTVRNVVLMQIKNDGPAGAFPQEDEVSAKINNGLTSGGYDSSFSVLINAEGSGLMGYVYIGADEYVEFGLGTLGYNRAQDQYGEDDGLLTLTTTENMNSYGIAVVFDNTVLSTTNREPYRIILFNLVFQNSRTVEQLGETLNSLGANITLNNVAYGLTALELNDKKNADTLLGWQRFNAYAEVRNLSNNNFAGNYLMLGSSLTLLHSASFLLGISGFYSPYTSHTIYDLQEQSGNIGASVFAAVPVGSTALIFDIGVLYSSIHGKALEVLNFADRREYNYGAGSVNAIISFNFGSYFSQRLLVSAFARQSASYVEDPSDLALNVTTPSYSSMFVGYYSKLLNNSKSTLEFGFKYYFKETQKRGVAGFVNDPSSQQWVYQYILLDNPLELDIDFTYKIGPYVEFKGSFNKRGTYSNLGVYVMYKKAISGDMSTKKENSFHYNIRNVFYSNYDIGGDDEEW